MNICNRFKKIEYLDRRVVVINNWITARYFKESDLQVFVRDINELEKCKISISPSVKISAPVNARKTADILLCIVYGNKRRN